MAHIYQNNNQGKKEFVENVLNEIVMAEGHFKCCYYVDKKYDEYIVLVPHGSNGKEELINITADSIESVCRDFCKWFDYIISRI